jgi:hypothetical protein
MQSPPYKNSVFINKSGYIEIILIGDQSEDTFRHSYYEAQPLLEKLKASKKPLFGLIDMSQQTGYTLASDKAALDILESLDYDKLAMCNVPHSRVAQGIIQAIGKDHNTKIFSSRDDALAWLHAN